MIDYTLFLKVLGEDYLEKEKKEPLRKESENFRNALKGIKEGNIVFMEETDSDIYACVKEPFMQKIYMPFDVKYVGSKKPYEILHGSLEDVHNMEVLKFVESKTEEELAMYIVLAAYYEECNDGYEHINRILKGSF